MPIVLQPFAFNFLQHNQNKLSGKNITGKQLSYFAKYVSKISQNLQLTSLWSKQVNGKSITDQLVTNKHKPYQDQIFSNNTQALV